MRQLTTSSNVLYIFCASLLFITSNTKAQSSDPSKVLYPYYKVEVTNHSSGESKIISQEGTVTINLNAKTIVISHSPATDTFFIGHIKKWRKTGVDTGFTAECSGRKGPMRFVSFDQVDATAFGYKTALMFV